MTRQCERRRVSFKAENANRESAGEAMESMEPAGSARCSSSTTRSAPVFEISFIAGLLPARTEALKLETSNPSRTCTTERNETVLRNATFHASGRLAGYRAFHAEDQFYAIPATILAMNRPAQPADPFHAISQLTVPLGGDGVTDRMLPCSPLFQIGDDPADENLKIDKVRYWGCSGLLLGAEQERRLPPGIPHGARRVAPRCEAYSAQDSRRSLRGRPTADRSGRSNWGYSGQLTLEQFGAGSRASCCTLLILEREMGLEPTTSRELVLRSCI